MTAVAERTNVALDAPLTRAVQRYALRTFAPNQPGGLCPSVDVNDLMCRMTSFVGERIAISRERVPETADWQIGNALNAGELSEFHSLAVPFADDIWSALAHLVAVRHLDYDASGRLTRGPEYARSL